MLLNFDLPLVLPERVTPQVSLARAIGLGATLFAYPLVEIHRTCTLQTQVPSPSRRDINTLIHIRQPATARQRDVVTPAHDLLYTNAWLSLTDGPLALSVPASTAHPGRYFVLALYDAYTENFMNLGPLNCAPEGETVWLLGPDGGVVPDGARTVRCPTRLVWLIARVLVRDGEDLAGAQALQSDIRLHHDNPLARQPWAVAHWQGPVTSLTHALRQPSVRGEDLAPGFFTHFCQALHEAPGRPQDQNLLRWISQAGLRAHPHFDWNALAPWCRDGLAQGFAEAIRLLDDMPRSHGTEAWRTPPVIGRYGNDYLARALTACTGLGALSPEEALYATSHFSSDQRPLHGRRRYTLRFEPGQWPPADAFWSVTLYDADRFLYDNPLGRHSAGDRSPWLRPEPDGSLVIHLAHQSPTDTSNWLPAPAGPFYLVMRLYHPRPEARHWIAPALQALPD